MNDLNWTEIAIAGVIFILLTLFFTWKSKRALNEGWTGTVESVAGQKQSRWSGNEEGGMDKKAVQLPMLDTIDVVCKLDNGKTKTVRLGRIGFGSAFPYGIYAGDRVVKKPGESLFHVIKVEKRG